MQVPGKPSTRWLRVVSRASARVSGGRMVVRRRSRRSGIELVLIQAREQLLACLPIQQARDREAIAGLEGADRRLCLGRKEPIDGPRLIPEVAQMSFATEISPWLRIRSSAGHLVPPEIRASERGERGRSVTVQADMKTMTKTPSTRMRPFHTIGQVFCNDDMPMSW
jgi:hypothetical protein